MTRAFAAVAFIATTLALRFEKEIKAWKRFALTDDLKAADIVMTLSEETLEAKGHRAKRRHYRGGGQSREAASGSIGESEIG